MVTTIIENRICCWPTFLRYSAIIHALLSRAYLASAIGTSCYECNTVERKQCVVEAFKANASSSRSLGGDSPNHNQTVGLYTQRNGPDLFLAFHHLNCRSTT